MIIVIWLIAMLIIIVSLARQPNNPTPIVNISKTGLGLPTVGIQRYNQPFWVNELMAGIPVDFGSYYLTVKDNYILVNDEIISVKPRITSVTVYLIEFDSRVVLYRGSPFIKTNLPYDTNAFYAKNGYIWLKLDLPAFYGEITPLVLREQIRITNHSIEVDWSQSIYYWIPKHLAQGWQGDVLYQMNNKLLVYGKRWVYSYIPTSYRLVDNILADLYDQRLVYNVTTGQVEPIKLVIKLVKESIIDQGIPINQAQRDRLKLLATSLLNNRQNQYFCLIPMIDLYSMKVVDEQITIDEALSIIASLVKWNSLVN